MDMDKIFIYYNYKVSSVKSTAKRCGRYVDCLWFVSPQQVKKSNETKATDRSSFNTRVHASTGTNYMYHTVDYNEKVLS